MVLGFDMRPSLVGQSQVVGVVWPHWGRGGRPGRRVQHRLGHVLRVCASSIPCLLGCCCPECVTSELNVLLDLSWKAATKSLSPLQTKPLLQVLSESTWTVAVRVIHGDEGVGDIPGVRGGSGGRSEDRAQ